MPREVQLRFEDEDMAALIKKAKGIVALEPETSEKYKQAFKFLRDNDTATGSGKSQERGRTRNRQGEAEDEESRDKRRDERKKKTLDSESSGSDVEVLPQHKNKSEKRQPKRQRDDSSGSEDAASSERKKNKQSRKRDQRRRMETEESDSAAELEKHSGKKDAKKGKQRRIESDSSGTGGDDSDGGDSEAAGPSSKAHGKRKVSSSKRSGKSRDSDDEYEDHISDNEVSQKRWKLVKSGEKTQSDGKGKKKVFKMIQRNYAPNEAPDSQHKYYFRAHIGAGFHVSVAKWLKNKQRYIQIRKASSGANIPISMYKHLKAAINDIELKREEEKLFFFRTTQQAKIPKRGSSNAAGFDLASVGDYTLAAHTTIAVDTGLKIILPPDCYGRLASRSGLALKHCLVVVGGVIDGDYTGTIQVILMNLGCSTVYIRSGDRVAQLVVEKYFTGEAEEVLNFDRKTARGEQGFGSTGGVHT